MDTLKVAKQFLDRVSVVIDKPVQVTDVTEKGINYWTIISTAVAIISIAMLIYDRVKRSKIYGKVLSITATFKSTFEYTGYDRTRKKVQGLTFTIKISIGAYKKDFYYSDVNVFANFPSSKKCKGEIFFSREEIINNMGGTGKKYKLVVPPGQYLTYNNLIEKNRVHFFYLKFIIPDKFDEELFESIDLQFITPSKKRKWAHLTIIDEKQIFFDEDLSKPV